MPAYSDLIENNVPEALHPIDQLKSQAALWQMKDIYSEAFALELDSKKVCPSFRERFFYPIMKDLPEGEQNLIKNLSN